MTEHRQCAKQLVRDTIGLNAIKSRETTDQSDFQQILYKRRGLLKSSKVLSIRGVYQTTFWLERRVQATFWLERRAQATFWQDHHVPACDLAWYMGRSIPISVQPGIWLVRGPFYPEFLDCVEAAHF